TMGNETRRFLMYNGLSHELKQAIAHADTIPDDYDEWVTWLIKKDIRLETRRQEVNAYRPRQSYQPRAPATPQAPPAPRTPYNPPRSSPAPATPVANPTSSNSGYYGPAPMDLSAGRRQLTNEERARRL